jgi:hypothetical protein
VRNKTGVGNEIEVVMEISLGLSMPESELRQPN